VKATVKDPALTVQVGEGVQGKCGIGLFGTFHGWAVPVSYAKEGKDAPIAFCSA